MSESRAGGSAVGAASSATGGCGCVDVKAPSQACKGCLCGCWAAGSAVGVARSASGVCTCACVCV
jgi:hypothetical protein